MAYFNGVRTSSELGTLADVENIEKSLSAGYGTDSATYVNGRAMIPEDLEATVVNVVAQTKEDCKVLNTMKKTPAKSTVHEFNRRTDHGNYRHLSTAEGGRSSKTSQELERATVDIKYLQTRRSVTDQMTRVSTFENAYASEKIAGVETVTKGIENLIFHGNSAVVPTEFDGFISTLNKTKNAFKYDYRGDSLGSANRGTKVLNEIATEVWNRNGDLDRMLFPSALAGDVRDLVWDKLYRTPDQPNYIGPYPSTIGSLIRWTGEDAGADKFYRVKGKVVAEGSVEDRPNPPASVTASAATKTGSKFAATDAGDYHYTVHAVNEAGISEGVALTAAVSVASGDGVTLTITPASTGKAATGFIICRSKKDGTEVMEMDSIGIGAGATTEYVDLNEELPGTASMVFLPKAKIQSAFDLVQLLPVCTYPLYPTDTAETPFLILAYIALAVKAPEHLALAKNIAYSGGLY